MKLKSLWANQNVFDTNICGKTILKTQTSHIKPPNYINDVYLMKYSWKQWKYCNPRSGSCCRAVRDSAVGCKLFRQRVEWYSLSGLCQKQEPAPREDLLPEAARPPACSRERMDGAVMSAALKHRLSAHYWESFFFFFGKNFFRLSLTGTFRVLGFQNSAKPWRLILKVCCWVK